ncbi:hypothetical protein ACWEN6_08435 [Sphaerisporangium sp. NPDC004334]
MQPRVAVIGSAHPGRSYDPPLRTSNLALQAAVELGRELAIQKCRIVVYSSDEKFIEEAVVRGYVEGGGAGELSIQVSGPFGGDMSFIEMIDHRELFDLRPEASNDWEVSYYRSLLTLDGVLLIGGGRSTFIAGLISISRSVALCPVACLGGAAEQVWHRLANEPAHTNPEDLAVMANEWNTGSARAIVGSLVGQHKRRMAARDEERRREWRFERRAMAGLAVGALLLLMSVATIPFIYAAPSGSPALVALLVAAPLFAATCGAIVRNASEQGGQWVRTAVLGAAAGSVACLLFVAAQIATTPDMLNGDGARRLIFFILPIGFVAGLTFDAVYNKLRAHDVTETSALGHR